MGKAVKATEKEQSDVERVEQLLKKRLKLEALQAAIMGEIQPKVTKIAKGVKDIDLELLELANKNMKKWWPGDGKTKVFDSGKLFWRAQSSLITEDGESVSEDNTDLLALAKKKGYRDLVKITPVFSNFKAAIELGKMPKGFDTIEINVVDRFNVTTEK